MKKYEVKQKQGFLMVENRDGKTLGVSSEDMIIEHEGYAFKDLNHNGKMEPFKDWRLPISDRIEDLLSRLQVDEALGLMFYSIQQTVSKIDPFAKFQHYGSSPSDDSLQ
ncbi:MAG: hypothetical protein ACK5LL_06920, partial [Suipraeoptans sp.]